MATKLLRMQKLFSEVESTLEDQKRIFVWDVGTWKDVVEFGSYGSVTDRSDALRMFLESAIPYL